MSDPLSIAFVVEGPTDFVMLKAIVSRILDGRDFVPTIVQPELDRTGKALPGESGLGWPGVFRWCRQASQQAGGGLSNNPLFLVHDLLVLQVDADVAEATYAQGHIEDPVPKNPTLPCVLPCPPPSATTNRLRAVILLWIGETALPPQTVFCTPSKALEAWILAGLFPDDPVVQKGKVECHANPENLLRAKPKKQRLISGGKKQRDKYDAYARHLADNWDFIKRKCTEAYRFESDFLSVLTP